MEYDKVLKNITHYLNSPKSIITDIFPLEGYNDYPRFFQYTTSQIPIDDKSSDLLSNGIDFDKKGAIVKAVMETIERYYMFKTDKKGLFYGTYSQAKQKLKNAISPVELSPFSKKQLDRESYKKFRIHKDTSLYWVEAQSLFRRDKFFLPAQLFYFLRFDDHPNKSLIYHPSSSGAAAGISIEDALYGSLCELIERDAYMIWFYSMLTGKKIRLSSIHDKEIQNLIAYLNRYLFKVYIFNITQDINIPVFFTILLDATKKGPPIVVGAKCDVSWKKALIGSLLEAVQSLTSLRDIYMIKKHSPEQKFNGFIKNITFSQSIVERFVYWLDESSLRHLNHLFQAPEINIGDLYKHTEINIPNNYSHIKKILKKNKIHDVFWVKTSPETLDKFSIYSIKTVVPGLVPLSIHKDYSHFGHKRVYEVPRRCLGIEKGESELQIIPHPLP